MENDIKSENKEPKIKKPSLIENIGKMGMKLGDTIGRVFTEFFTGKPPSEEEKIRKSRLKQLKNIQEEAQFQKDLELAKQGLYKPPEKPIIARTKKKEESIFSNLGKNNPIADFNQTKSLGNSIIESKKLNNVNSKIPQNFGFNGIGKSKNPMEIKTKNNKINVSQDFGFSGIGKPVNPMGNKK